MKSDSALVAKDYLIYLVKRCRLVNNLILCTGCNFAKECDQVEIMEGWDK